ncbi:hypothetical protein VTO73DRAFT_652 [Trametes versicolor]
MYSSPLSPPYVCGPTGIPRTDLWHFAVHHGLDNGLEFIACHQVLGAVVPFAPSAGSERMCPVALEDGDGMAVRRLLDLSAPRTLVAAVRSALP